MNGFNINVEGDSKNNNIYTKAEWVSVEDELPERREPVLILCSYGKMATAILSDRSKPNNGWTDWMRAQHTYGSVTHWMPLPKPPKE